MFDRPSEASTDLDPWKYSGYPGISYTAKDQCEILLRDHSAYVFVNGPQTSLCDNLHCRTPSRPGFFFAGPALKGTNCGAGRWCEDGFCVIRKSVTTTSAPPPPTTTIMPTTQKPFWGPWKASNCKSECLKFGKGYQAKRRFCSQGGNSCDGLSFSVGTCDDKKLCSTRKSISDYGKEKCQEFSRKLDQIDPKSLGLQAPHETGRPWMACAVFCKRKGSPSYFTPRLELNELGLNPYFPDGALCHRESTENFYCIQHHCLPEVSGID